MPAYYPFTNFFLLIADSVGFKMQRSTSKYMLEQLDILL